MAHCTIAEVESILCLGFGNIFAMQSALFWHFWIQENWKLQEASDMIEKIRDSFKLFSS